MKTKTDRKSAIVSIIGKMSIHTHEELSAALLKKGIDATQATLSRDMREIGAVKGPDGCYLIPSSAAASGMGFSIDVECSGQLCVAHTRPGFASAFASVVDSSGMEGVMGTIAGDDTVLIILRENADKKTLMDKIKQL